MNKTPNSHTPVICGRQDELVAYLYNEADGNERAGFEQHLKECAACGDELRAFEGVRHELGLWQVPFAPRVEIALANNRWQTFRELISLFPAWARVAAAGAMAAAAALVFFSLIGTSLSVNSNGVSLAFGGKPTPVVQPSPVKEPPAINVNEMITRRDAEALIEQAVAQAQARSQSEAQAQLASLEQRLNAAHQAKLTAVVQKLSNDHRMVVENLIRQERKQTPSLREWLFASNEESDAEVKANEKSN
ncbi:MAG TPA: zf-HC2 domain-containing protein [Blastocatellia bacterium]|nr:zf-HC2 domain-containing protein [Blastocatellia bacterium]